MGYVDELKRKFGTEWPSMDTKCKVCNCKYALHYGPSCPGKEDPRRVDETE